jgi:hypothetical protein
MTDILWCAHVRGPDDVLPTPSYEHAVELCDRINDFVAKMHAQDPSENWPRVSALPAIWPWSADQHAEAVAGGNAEYGIDPFPARVQEGAR